MLRASAACEEAGVPTSSIVSEGFTSQAAAVAAYRALDLGGVARDIQNLQIALKGVAVEEAFVTSVAPASTAYNGVNEHYGSEREYVMALADALAEEYRAIAAAGLGDRVVVENLLLLARQFRQVQSETRAADATAAPTPSAPSASAPGARP